MEGLVVCASIFVSVITITSFPGANDCSSCHLARIPFTFHVVSHKELGVILVGAKLLPPRFTPREPPSSDPFAPRVAAVDLVADFTKGETFFCKVFVFLVATLSDVRI